MEGFPFASCAESQTAIFISSNCSISIYLYPTQLHLTFFFLGGGGGVCVSSVYLFLAFWFLPHTSERFQTKIGMHINCHLPFREFLFLLAIQRFFFGVWPLKWLNVYYPIDNMGCSEAHATSKEALGALAKGFTTSPQLQ